MKLGTSYFGNRWLKHAERDLRDIKAHHCDWVLHTFDEVDLRFNQGTMQALTRLSHAAGLKVYYSPWAVGGIFGGESLSAFTGRHPDACQVLNTGERTPHACPAHPQFRAFMKRWIEAACAAGGDCIFWDEPHLWIAGWEGRRERADVFSMGSLYAHALWRKRHKKPVPKRRSPETDAFRDKILYDFLKWAMETAKRTRASIKNAVCLLPRPCRGRDPLWERTAALKSLDIFATDPYWKHMPTANPRKSPLEGYVDEFSRRLVDLGRRHRVEVQAWVQLFALRRQDHADVDKAVAMMAAAGVKNIGAWGYEGCAAYAQIASEDSKALWDRLGKIYGGLKRGARLNKK